MNEDDNLLHLFPPAEPEPIEDDVLAAVVALDDVADTAEAVVGGVLDLKRHARSDYSSVRAAAETAMTVARESLHSTLAADPSYVDTGTFRCGRHVDDALLAARRVAQRRQPPAWFQRPWIVTGVLITGCAAWLISQQHWLVAAGLVGARIAVSVRYGDEHNLPFEGRSSGTRASTIVYRCLAGHASDAVILIGVLWALLEAHRPLWAVATVASLAAMLLATLLRVAALQVGAQIYRLTAERVVRAGSLLIALVASAVAQPDLPAHGALWLGVAIAGPLLYGFGETARVTRRLRQTDIAYGGTLPQVNITVRDHRGSRRLPSDVDRRLRDHAPGGDLQAGGVQHAI
ncbi:MAG: hypothetical protein QOC82_1556 [Frankiaceae bacterium]|jgi:hypothetical protein|nr:hypothetical protein [Frankiaceae bacterium]